METISTGSAYSSSGASSSSGAGDNSMNATNPAPPALFSNVFYDVLLVASTNDINAAPWYTTFFPESIAAFICDIRRLFCGNVSLVIISTAIFLSGILILNRRMTWTWGIIIVLAATALVNAESLVGYILENSFNIPGTTDDVDLSIMTKVCVCF